MGCGVPVLVRGGCGGGDGGEMVGWFGKFDGR